MKNAHSMVVDLIEISILDQVGLHRKSISRVLELVEKFETIEELYTALGISLMSEECKIAEFEYIFKGVAKIQSLFNKIKGNHEQIFHYAG